MKGKWHFPLSAFLAGGLYAHIPEHWVWFAVCMVWLLTFSRFRMLFPLMLGAFFLGVLLYSPSLNPPVLEEGPISGEIISMYERNASTETVSFKTDEGLKLQVTHFSDSESDFFFHSFQAGASCVISGEIEEYSNARNPGEFDYANFMKKQDFDGQLLIDRSSSVSCTEGSFQSRFYDQRERIREQSLEDTPDSLKPWVEALVFGDQDGIDENILQAFREWGLSHVLAISGLHVGLLCAIIYALLYRSGLATLSQVQVLVFLFLPVFAFIAGGQPSVLRASMMVFFLLGLWALHIRPSMTDLLSGIAFLLLLSTPSLVYNIGFQFSFAVTFSLLLSAPILKNDTRPWVLSLRVSLISQLAILPLQLHYFYQFSPLSVLFNLLLVPYFTIFFIPFIFLLLLSMYVLPDFLYSWMAGATGKVHMAVMDIVVNVGNEWNVQWVTGAFPYVWFVPYYVCFFLMMNYFVKGKLAATFAGGLSLTLVLFINGMLPYFDEEGSVTFLDVGQGDSAVIELPYRRGVILVDAAGPPPFLNTPDKTAERIILPYLRSKGIASLDVTFVTHDDTDHNGSVKRLVEEGMTGSLFVSLHDDEDYGQPTQKLKNGDRYDIAGHSFFVLAPGSEAKEKNDNSLVLYTKLGEKHWMFTGDISAEVEEELVSEYGRLPVDVVKVAHHGSKTSTSESFVKTFSPGIGVISAGENNRYGHPHPDVLERLSSFNVDIWRTDEVGAVTVIFTEKGKKKISGYLSP